MRPPRRVVVLVLAVVATLAVAAAAAQVGGRGGGSAGSPPASGRYPPSISPAPTGPAGPTAAGKPSGDGSVTSPPEQQPAFPVHPLAPGERPPQLVVVGFDGSGDVSQLQAWGDLTRRLGTHVTYFLSGVFLLDRAARMHYQPPRHRRGASDIGFARSQDPVPEVASLLSQAWLAGDDIGTHFNGHFCGPTGVSRWSAADWSAEIRQFDDFVDHWRTYDHMPGGRPASYDHTVVVGGRTPCLEGNPVAYRTAMALAGYRYDTSGTGALAWPRKTTGGLWEFPLQTIRWKGPGGGSQIAMDYNFWYRYNRAMPIVRSYQRVAVSDAVYRSYLAAFQATYSGNRAPLFFGNHMNYWGCDPAYRECLHSGRLSNPNNLEHYGPFVDGLQRAYEVMCVQPDVQCVSYRDVADWLDVQTPSTLARLQALAPVTG